MQSVDGGKGRRHLLHVFPTFARGGSQTRFAQLVGLHGPRYRHTVLAIDGVATMADGLRDCDNVFCLPGTFKTNSPISGVSKAHKMLRQLRPDVLVTYNWGAMDWCVAARLCRQRLHVHIEDGFGSDEAAGPLRRRSVFRRILLSGGRTDVVVPSRRLEELARMRWGIPHGRLHYVPNGINCRRFLPRAVDTGPTEECVIGTVATLRKEKNISCLLRMFDGIAGFWPRARLLIVGDGPERPALEYEAMQSRFHSRIEFTGATSSPEKHLAKIDIFALTSDTEQMPLSVLEAMASGLPLVSFDVGDVRNMVAEANIPFATITPGDVRSYCKNVERLMANPGLRARIGDQNREAVVVRFDENAMAKSYAAIFG